MVLNTDERFDAEILSRLNKAYEERIAAILTASAQLEEQLRIREEVNNSEIRRIESAHQAQIEALFAQKDALAHQYRDQLAQLNDALETHRSSLITLENRADEERTVAQVRIAEIEAAHAAVENRSEQLEEQLRETEEVNNNEIRRIKSAHQAQIEALFGHKDALVQQYEERLFQLNDALETHRSSLMALESRAGVLYGENTVLEKRADLVDTLQAQIEQYRNSQEQVRHDLARSHQQIEDLTESLTESRRTIVFAENQETSLRQSLEQARVDLAGAKQKIETLGHINIEHQKQLAAVQAEQEMRLESFSRNARAREDMLRDAHLKALMHSEANVLEHQHSARQFAARNRILTDGLAMTLFRQRRRLWSGMRDRDVSSLSVLLKQSDVDIGILHVAKSSRQPADRWLRDAAEGALFGRQSMQFEVACASKFSVDEYVAVAFHLILGRAVDETGLQDYVSRLRAGHLRRDILRDLAISSEAKDRLGGLGLMAGSDQQCIDLAYQTLLGRSVDPAGLDHYLAQLAGGKSRSQMFIDVARSREARAKPTDLAVAIRLIRDANGLWFQWRFRVVKKLRFDGAKQERLWLMGRLAELDGLVRRNILHDRQSEFRSPQFEHAPVAPVPASPSVRVMNKSVDVSPSPSSRHQKVTEMLADSSRGRTAPDILKAIRLELSQLSTH